MILEGERRCLRISIATTGFSSWVRRFMGTTIKFRTQSKFNLKYAGNLTLPMHLRLISH